jgi:uncharacterized protein
VRKLEGYPTLSHIIDEVDAFLRERHPLFFGGSPVHPHSPLKPYKVIHDQLWGTNRFSWRELALIDSPVLQRLRGIHQTGLAYYVYPSATHSRFEHSLGVLTVASRIFDSLAQRCLNDLEMIAQAVEPECSPTETLARLRQEIRLAALLHDTGHSLYSHASEHVYSEIPLLKKASAELSTFAGKEKGSGEVLSFCIARTKSISDLLDRAKQRVPAGGEEAGEFSGQIDLDNVSLLIIGRSQHPFLQFMGDIISSGFDSDKLDYLLRDAATAGLPMRYDLERYLYTVYLEKNEITDGEDQLQKLYSAMGSNPTRNPAGVLEFPYYDTYRLKLPKLAMSTIEQIIICKLMLFSYIYHHQKVRAAEGLLGKMLKRAERYWRSMGNTDEEILKTFLAMTDASLDGFAYSDSENVGLAKCGYRLLNRLLPREVYKLSKTVSHAEGALISNYFSKLEDKSKRTAAIQALEDAIGEELLKLSTHLGTSPEDALWNAGAWVDVPKVPKFEGVSDLVGRTKDSPGVPISEVFPIGHWTQAYEAHRFFVRIYAFSEWKPQVEEAAQKAIKRVIGVKSNDFFESAKRKR